MRFKTEMKFLFCFLGLWSLTGHQVHAFEKAQLSASLDQYINVSESGQSSDQVVSAQLLRSSSFLFGTTYVMDADLLWSGNERALFYNIKNLNVSLGSIERLIVGIHQEAWNEGLDFWGSSEWGPQMQRNKLRVGQGGLPGVFYKKQMEGLTFTAMYSPYFLPHMGPDYDFAGGNVISQSPWFLPPPETVPYEGESFQTNYSLDEPRIMSFLQVPAYGVAFEYWPNKELYLRMNWVRKANPHMLLDLNFTANASDPDVPIDVLVKPRIAEHELRSLEASWKVSKRTRLRASVLQEVFDQPRFDTHQFTYQTFTDQTVYSLILSQERYDYTYSLGVLVRDGGHLGSVGELSSALVHQGVRHIYQRAVKGTLGLKNLWSWEAEGSVAYDWTQRGFIATLNVKRSINKNTYIELGVDAIEPFKDAPEGSFIYQYRNLDRVWAGVAYVF
ncbi:MAG: hypothetical protein M9899_07310 [Bdellovibrionaceae bacterium]|nr:hypothetical protein [Pseudobdellovibrionaceae bacterium]